MAKGTRIKHMLAVFCGLIICTCLLSSCKKESTNTSYTITFGWTDLTQPRDIPDPEIRAAYDQILTDIYNLKPTTDDYWQVWVVNNNYKAEDKKAEGKFNSHLADVKQMETRCKDVIENLEIRAGSSFSVSVVYKLKRWDTKESADLQKYDFELRYNVAVGPGDQR